MLYYLDYLCYFMTNLMFIENVFVFDLFWNLIYWKLHLNVHVVRQFHYKTNDIIWTRCAFWPFYLACVGVSYIVTWPKWFADQWRQMTITENVRKTWATFYPLIISKIMNIDLYIIIYVYLYCTETYRNKMMRRTHVNLATKQCCSLCCQFCYVV